MFFRAPLALSSLVLCAALGAQQAADSTLSAARIPAGAHAPVIDGRLDDAAWRAAPPISDLRQREPYEGAPATERTEVRVVYDGEVLYVGIHAFDREPGRIVARILERDRVMQASDDGSGPAFGGDDAVAILLDGFHDHRNAVVLATNANGAEFDALLTDEGREFNVDWRGIWKVASVRMNDGWSTEFAIPFRTLRYRPDGNEWGLNVYRMIRRQNEQVLWRGWTRSGGGFARVSLAGHLRGLNSLPQPGRNVELRPYVLQGLDRERNDSTHRFEDTRRHGIGGELKAQLRPGLVLDATVNTDFAQVEADAEQVNLTRFSLFFPEKREFFLENAGIFEFGARGQYAPPPFLMFFSRQIGITEDGPVPVFGGGRLTGRLGAQTVGLLSMATDTAFDQPRTLFNVLRVKRDIGGNNYIGAMVTDRRSSAAYNTVGGLDFSAWPAQALNVQGFVAQTTTRGPGGDGGAARLAMSLQTGRFGFSLQHVRIGEDADAQLGFVTRNDIQQTGGNVRVTFRPRLLGLRTLSVMSYPEYVARLTGVMQDWRASALVDAQFNSGTSVTAYHRFAGVRIDEAFDLADSVPVPVGTYDATTDGFFAGTDPSLPLTFNGSGEFSRAFGGHIGRLTAGSAARVGTHVGLGVDGTRSWVNLPNGAFRADLLSSRVSLAFTTQMFLNALVQYNSFDRTVSSNVRFQYIFRPGSDIYLVYNEERGDLRSLATPQARGVRLKVAYLRRF